MENVEKAASVNSFCDFIPRRLTSWNCASCSQKSVDARRVCAFCLSIEPGVLREKQQNSEGKINKREKNNRKNNTDKKTGECAVIHTCVEPAVLSQVSYVQILRLPHGRCYRVFATDNTISVDKFRTSTNACANLENIKLEDTEEVGKNTGKSNNNNNNTTFAEIEKKENSSCMHDINLRGKMYTHFVSLPIGGLSAVLPNASVLLEEMRHRCIDPAVMVTEDIFTTAPRMHMTLLMLSLLTDEAVAIAVDCMNILYTKIRSWIEIHQKDTETSESDWRPQIHLGGLHVMKNRGGSNKKANVLYMGVKDSSSLTILETLQRFVYESFAELIKNDSDQLNEGKLFHVTLMNTKWREENMKSNDENRKGKKEGGKASAFFSKRVPFDATYILREFAEKSLCGDGENGAIVLERVDLNALNYNAELQSYSCEYCISL